MEEEKEEWEGERKIRKTNTQHEMHFQMMWIGHKMPYEIDDHHGREWKGSEQQDTWNIIEFTVFNADASEWSYFVLKRTKMTAKK